MKIVLKNLNVGKISHSSGVFSGENLQIDWNSYKKINEGFGTMLGSYNKSTKNRHVVQKVDFEGKKIKQEDRK